jgi:spore germination protein PC
MYTDLYSYAAQMQKYLQAQEYRIALLEKEIQVLKKQFTEIKEKPSVTVEKIEYKFDQLKVETLEGTLNIGLNPQDLQNVDEFSVPQATPTFQTREAIKKACMEELTEYIHSNTVNTIKHFEQFYRKEIDEAYQNHIEQDLLKQLEKRVDYYLDNSLPEEQSENQKDFLKEKIKHHIITDITQAISAFIMNIP